MVDKSVKLLDSLGKIMLRKVYGSVNNGPFTGIMIAELP